MFLTWENSQHFEMPPLFSLENNIWGMSTEIPFWWHVTTQIWVVLGHATSLFQSNCLKQSSHITRPIGSSAQIWVVTHLHFGISVHRGNQWHLQRSAVFSGFINFLPFLWLGEGGGGDKRSARVKFSVAVATKGSSYLYTRTCIWKMCWTLIKSKKKKLKNKANEQKLKMAQLPFTELKMHCFSLIFSHVEAITGTWKTWSWD